MTTCELALETEDALLLVGVLAQMKGRIRHSSMQLPQEAKSDLEGNLAKAFDAGYSMAYGPIVTNALSALPDAGNIALIDQLAVRSAYMISSAVQNGITRTIGGTISHLPESGQYDPSVDFRGRGRAEAIRTKVQELIGAISKHADRCAMVLPEEVQHISNESREQLHEWAEELNPMLKDLGGLFFPEEIVDAFRNNAIKHVVLCVDPLFAHVPYAALIGSRGPIVDEPWSLSILTASTELWRAIERRRHRSAQKIAYFAPDAVVNSDLGGAEELKALKEVSDTTDYLENAATTTRLINNLKAGKWCHFRGHGKWTGEVQTSGLEMANGEVLTTFSYPKESEQAGFLLTAACHTGFADAVGTEPFGSFVDYDNAGLFGAIFTAWPIHGPAATVTTGFLYEALRKSQDASRALKEAALQTRELLPHPYFWAPFIQIGGWDCSEMIRWKQKADAPVVIAQ